jgi:FkbM family methyltransferase
MTPEFSLKSNVHISDLLKIQLQRSLGLGNLSWFKWVRGSVTNWLDYYLVKIGIKQSASLMLKTGQTVQVKHEFFDEVYQFIHSPFGNNGSLSPLQDGYQVTLKNNDLRFFVRKPRESSVLFETFVKEEYKDLNVSGKWVVDIGANIGDSAIYFSKVGNAKRVIALEPYPYSYDLAQKNVKINDTRNVTLLNAGLGGRKTEILLDPNYTAGTGDGLKQSTASKNGTKVDVLTLHELLNLYEIGSSVMKIDCEGCEYDLILGSAAEDLRRFDEILVECHYGYLNIEEKLRLAGFRTVHSGVKYGFIKVAGLPEMCINLVHAKKIQREGNP